MTNNHIVCKVGLYKDCWRQVVLAQITTALRRGYTAYRRPTDTRREWKLMEEYNTILSSHDIPVAVGINVAFVNVVG